MGILSGLKSLGLGSLENVSLFEEPKKKETEKAEQAAALKVAEKDLVYDRSFVCPVCDCSFTQYPRRAPGSLHRKYFHLVLRSYPRKSPF